MGDDRVALSNFERQPHNIAARSILGGCRFDRPLHISQMGVGFGSLNASTRVVAEIQGRLFE